MHKPNKLLESDVQEELDWLLRLELHLDNFTHLPNDGTSREFVGIAI